MPGFRLLAHRLGEQLLAGHLHSGRKIDRARHEFAAIDGAAVGQRHADRTPAGDLDVLHVRAGDNFAAAGFDDTRERKRQRHCAAGRQREARDIGEDGGKHDAGAGHILGRDHVHIRREQRTDALVDKMLAYDAEEVVLRVRQQLFCLGTAEPVDELLARHRRVVEERHQKRPHLLAIGMPERPEGLGVLL